MANWTRAKRRNSTYRIWYSMVKRCTDPKHVSYPNYGGRGVQICKQWVRSFPAFVHHAGLRPSKAHSIDRIDASKGYEPGNVRWTTIVEQNRNKRGTIYLDDPDHPGEKITVGALAERLGLTYRQLRSKLLAQGKWPTIGEGEVEEEEEDEDEGEDDDGSDPDDGTDR